MSALLPHGCLSLCSEQPLTGSALQEEDAYLQPLSTSPLYLGISALGAILLHQTTVVDLPICVPLSPILVGMCSYKYFMLWIYHELFIQIEIDVFRHIILWQKVGSLYILYTPTHLHTQLLQGWHSIPNGKTKLDVESNIWASKKSFPLDIC